MKTSFLALIALIWGSSTAKAQFYTLKSDSARITSHRFVKAKQPKTIEAPPIDTDEVEADTTAALIDAPPPFIRQRTMVRVDSARMIARTTADSLLDKLTERINVCLPLDLLRVSSKYGTRKDPITKCATFHDGIDLACRKEHVYSMLPAVVKKVHRGNKGYGNYVILHHGRLECLYGHLDAITVKEGDVINAGTIVGISGNTGKSTGYHLHIRLRNDGKSVDPLFFIEFLKAYIHNLNTELSDIVTPTPDRPSRTDLSLQAVYREIVSHGILYPKIVLSQAVLETGHFTSRVCHEYNNLFGLRRRTGEYYRFDTWQESVKAYRDYVQYKYKGGDYFAFLDRIGYAEDKTYTAKVRTIVNTIKDKVGEL